MDILVQGGGDMGEVLLTVGIVIGVSFFCSLCEAVLYSVPYSYVELLAARGGASGRLLRRMRENISRPISAILTLNTVANTFGAAVAGAAAVSALGRESLEVFSAGLTLGVLVLSEIFPKTIGVRYCKGLSHLVALPMYLLQWALLPVTWSTSVLTRWLGSTDPSRGVTAEELQVMARLGRKTGALRGMEEAVIKNILSLRKVTARQIMTPRTVVFALSKDLSLREAKQASPLWPWPHSRVPVHEGDLDRIVGLVHRRDVLAALAEDREEALLSDFLRPVHMVPDMASADLLLQQFIERREHLFVVLDEFGGVTGVVTLEDVFETILGQEIVDESDLSVDLQKEARQRGKKVLGTPRS
jgi:CBS domain containing-hemolysin-like protein